MADFYKVLTEIILDDLDIPIEIKLQLKKEKIFSAYDLHKRLMIVKLMGEKGWPEVSQEFIKLLKDIYDEIKKGKDLTSKKDSIKKKFKAEEISAKSIVNTKNMERLDKSVIDPGLNNKTKPNSLSNIEKKIYTNEDLNSTTINNSVY